MMLSSKEMVVRRSRLIPHGMHRPSEIGWERTGVTKLPLEEARRLEPEGAWVLRTVVVMPDHVHLVVSLRETVGLAAAVRLLEGPGVPILRASEMPWERGYFDHRLRADEDRVSVFRYLWLNPYRAGLLRPGRTWPGYFCACEDRIWLGDDRFKDGSLPSWLG